MGGSSEEEEEDRRRRRDGQWVHEETLKAVRECWSHAGILTGTESRTGPDKQFVPSDLIYIDVELEEGCQSFRQHDRLDREKRRAAWKTD